MTEAERLAERLEELLAKAEQEDDDIRYYSGSSSKYAPHRDALNIAMSEALPVLLSALRSQAEELERLRGALRDVGVAWDSAPTVAGLLDGRAAKWFFNTLAPAMIAARKALNEQAARAALGEAKAAPEQEQA